MNLKLHELEPEAGASLLPVVHVINGEHYSGAERVQDLLAARLPEFGYDVTFACAKPGGFASLRQYRAAPIINMPMQWRLDVRPARRLAALVRRSGAVLLHAHTPRSLMLARLAAWWTGTPLVYHVHSPTSRDTTLRLRNRLNSAIERLSLRGAARLIAVSGSLARHMTGAGTPADRLITVPNGVPAWDPPPGDRATPRETWTLGTVALFRPRKGLEVLLEALAALRAKGLPVRLRAIGAFESRAYEDQVRQLAARLQIEPLIQWCGFCRDVAGELQKLDLFVLPSRFGEGLPMVLLEAMAAGVPVVATRVEGIPEAIRDGQEGILAEPGDAADLARAVAVVIDGQVDWQDLRRAALCRHRHEFSDRRMAEQVAGVYQQLLANPQRAAPAAQRSSASLRAASRSC